MFDRILLVLDEPGDLETLLHYVRGLARPGKSRVTILKTVPFFETIVDMPSELAPEADGDVESEEAFVTAIAEALKADGIDAEGSTIVGHSGLAIAAAAERVGATLIVVGAQPLPRNESLLHAVSIPLVAVPSAARVLGSRILSTPEALPGALQMADAFRSEIILLHLPGSGARPPGAAVVADLLVCSGNPAAEIERAFEKLGIGMIAVSSEGSPDELTRCLLREAPLPLLVVRRAPRRDEPESSPPKVVDLWRRRRTSANPLEGVGQVED